MKYIEIKKLVSINTNIYGMRSNKRNHYKTPSSDETAKNSSATSTNFEFFVSVPDSEWLCELPYQMQKLFIISV